MNLINEPHGIRGYFEYRRRALAAEAEVARLRAELQAMTRPHAPSPDYTITEPTGTAGGNWPK
jgi:hypothetical protein